MSRKFYSRISFFSYLIFTLTALVLGVVLLIDAITTPSEGWEGLGKAFAIIFALICFGYGIVAAVPTILKRCDLRFEKNFLTVLCIIFDVAFIGAHAALTYSVATSENNIVSLIIAGVLLLISVISLIANTLCLKAKY